MESVLGGSWSAWWTHADVRQSAAAALHTLTHDASARSANWPLMEARDAVAATAAYLVVVFALRLLVGARGRGVPGLQPLVLLHNLFMTALSLYMCVECVRQAIKLDFSLFGNAVDHTSDEAAGLANVLWLFYISKIFEFMDTIIMALRHRFHQISFLHVYHHSSIFLIWWGVVRHCPGGESYFSCILNSFVHVWMYGYYFWSALQGKRSSTAKPTWREPAFYRRYITRLQLTQFVLMLIQSLYDLVSPTSQFSRPCAAVLFTYMLTMLYLFGSFYAKNYRQAPKKVAVKEA